MNPSSNLHRAFCFDVRLTVFVCSLTVAALGLGGCKQSAQNTGSGTELVARTVEAACGQCQFNLPGSGCDLAIRFDGQAYFVDGSTIDDHGDAHAEDGLCNAIRKAKVSGTIRNGRFLASEAELLDD